MHSKEINISSFILKDITGAISVVYLIVSFFWDIFQKRDLSDIGSDFNPLVFLE